nr:GRAM domain-containing protein [Lysinibacillus timonensis]
MTVNLLTDEKILVEKTPANLFKGMEAVGGKLTITDKRLIFNAHKLNLQGGATEIHLTDIDSVTKASTFKIIPNRLIVHTKEGKTYKFVVYKRDKLWQLISDHLQ